MIDPRPSEDKIKAILESTEFTDWDADMGTPSKDAKSPEIAASSSKKSPEQKSKKDKKDKKDKKEKTQPKKKADASSKKSASSKCVKKKTK